MQLHSLLLIDQYTGPERVQPLQARVDLGVMVKKGYSIFAKAPALLEPLHQIVKCHIQDIC